MPNIRRAARTLLPLFPLLLLAALACGDAGGPVGPEPTLTGRWSGSERLGLLRVRAEFVQQGDSVTGRGEFSSPLGGDDFDAAGTVTGTDVRLRLVSDELGTATYVAHFVAADRVRGHLHAPGSRFDGMELTIDRQ